MAKGEKKPAEPGQEKKEGTDAFAPTEEDMPPHFGD